MAEIQWDNEPPPQGGAKGAQVQWDTPADTSPTRPSIIKRLYDVFQEGGRQLVEDVKAAPKAAYDRFNSVHDMSTTVPLALGGAPGVVTRLGAFAAGKMLESPSESPMENLKTAAKGVVGDPTKPMSMVTSPAVVEATVPFAGKVLRSTAGAKARIAAADAEGAGNVGAMVSPGLGLKPNYKMEELAPGVPVAVSTKGTTVKELREAAVQAPARLGAAKEAVVQDIETALNRAPGQTPNFTNAQGQPFVRVAPGHPMATTLNLGPGPPIPGGRGGTWAPARQQGEIPIPSLGKNMKLRDANDELSSVGDQMRGIKPLDPRYKDADLKQLYGTIARDIEKGITQVAGPQTAEAWKKAQAEYMAGRAFARIFQSPKAYRPGSSADTMELNTPYLQQYLIDPKNEAWLRRKLGASHFDELVREVTRGGGIGGKDVLAGGEHTLDATRQLLRSGGGTGTVMAAVPRTALPNVGSTYAGRQPYSVPGPVQMIADIEAQRAGSPPMPR